MEYVLIGGSLLALLLVRSNAGQSAAQIAPAPASAPRQTDVSLPAQLQRKDNGIIADAGAVVGEIKSLAGAGATIVGIGTSIGSSLGIGGEVAAPVIATGASAGGTAASAGGGAAAIAGGSTAAVAASGALAVGAAALITVNVVMMFQSLFGPVEPPEPVRRGSMNLHMQSLYGYIVVGNAMPVPPYLTNADDLTQMTIAKDWITKASNIYIASYGPVEGLRAIALNESLYPPRQVDSSLGKLRREY